MIMAADAHGGTVHLLGIGGSGMFPLALMLRDAGLTVSGSDGALSDARRAALRACGVSLSDPQDTTPIRRAARVVASPAIPAFDTGLRAARRACLPVQSRAEALAALLSGREVVCIAGSHGKSTATAMLIAIMLAAGRPFGHMLGATWQGTAPASLGSPGSPFLLEACEAHQALAAWWPSHVLLLNADDDHADHYGGVGMLHQAFAELIGRVPAGGAVVVNGDDPRMRALCPAGADFFGLSPDANLRAVLSAGVEGHGLLRAGAPSGILRLGVPGQHNLSNALGALGMALRLGVPSHVALRALASFQGIDRRLQRIVPRAAQTYCPAVLDDFAHHPAEIAASLRAAREGCRGHLVAVLEPQLHSRVIRLADSFAEALALADRRLILPVAAEGEVTAQGDGNSALAAACAAKGMAIERVSGLPATLAALRGTVDPSDTVIVMAGRSGEALARGLADGLSDTRIQGAQQPAYCPTPLSVLVGPAIAPARDIIARIRAHAEAYPDAPAVEVGGHCLSYSALLNRAAQISYALATRGIGVGDVVAVCLGRGTDRVAAFIAILSIGAVYLPLDPALPAERHGFMLSDSGARAVLVNAASPALPLAGVAFGAIACDGLSDLNPHIGNAGPAPDTPDALAYLIYTSGTTGRPKGVEVSRSALSSYAEAAIKSFRVTPAARMSMASSFSFDVAVGDMAVALVAGACLVGPTDIEAQPGAPLGRFIATSRITHLTLTPSALGTIPHGPFPDLSTVIVSGEVCPAALVAPWAPGRVFINAYGPTEATVHATFAYCKPGQPITIGAPFAGAGACILGPDLSLAAPWTEGELCIFGRGLARGYRNLPAETAERFVTLPAAPWTPRGLPLPVYRTGDRVQLGSDGALCFLGRIDDQIKFRGHRIEPAEIEVALCARPDIREACVSLVETHGGARLAAHVVLTPGTPSLDVAGVQRELALRLPPYMVPTLLVPMPALPLTANGKRDRGALPVPAHLAAPPAARAPATPTEARIHELARGLLSLGDPLSVRYSLARAGLDSLAMATLLISVEREFGVALDVAFDDGGDTIEALGLAVDARTHGTHRSRTGLRDGAHLIDALRPHLATWPGTALGPRRLIRSLADPHHAREKLFWVFQSGRELSTLHEAIGAAGPALFGLRSGHLAFRYNEKTLSSLARLYADEIAALAPNGPLVLGGNCQGGMIMHRVAAELWARGRETGLLILMEIGRFKHHAGRVLLLFGAESYLNPYGQIADPEAVFRAAYPAGHSVAILPGGHGQYFKDANVGALADIIRTATRF